MRHDAVVSGALLTRDETRVLSWSGDSTVRLWDVATGAQIGPAMTHQGRVFGARLTRDETRILSWSGDRTLRLWDAGTGRQLGPPMTHDTLVFDALFMHDETRILSLSYQTMQLWDVPCRAVARRDPDSVLVAANHAAVGRFMAWSQPSGDRVQSLAARS